MVALVARACLVLGLWVNGARGAACQGDASFHCYKFGSMVSVCTKRSVMSVVGRSVVLPCTFSLHSPSNEVSVEWRLREIKKGMVIFNSSNNNYTADNFRDRLRLLGDPGKGDASIIIVNLTRADINTYFCRIREWEMSEQRIKEYNYYGHHGTHLIVQGAVSEGDGSLQCSNFSYRASMCTERFVMGIAGSSALLPCTFSLNSLSNQVHVEWRLQEVNKGLLIFNSLNNYIEGKFQDRLRLVGDPTKGEASINITNLNCSDTYAYFCHIKELKINQQGNREYSYADQLGTLLVVKELKMNQQGNSEYNYANQLGTLLVVNDSSHTTILTSAIPPNANVPTGGKGCKRSVIAILVCSISLLAVSLSYICWIVLRTQHNT
ncbi:junctional adhesion molecule-like isoform X2 [Lampetra planeri]